MTLERRRQIVDTGGAKAEKEMVSSIVSVLNENKAALTYTLRYQASTTPHCFRTSNPLAAFKLSAPCLTPLIVDRVVYTSANVAQLFRYEGGGQSDDRAVQGSAACSERVHRTPRRRSIALHGSSARREFGVRGLNFGFGFASWGWSFWFRVKRLAYGA